MWAILPLKDFVSAKTRLSGVLTQVERRRLFHAMVEDVLNALQAAPSVSQIVIVSDDPSAVLLAEHYAAVLVDEPGGPALSEPLNRAIEAALAIVPETEKVLVLHADLPEICADDVEQIAVRALHSSSASVLLAADRIEIGTNALVFSAGVMPRFQFGANSLRRHCDMLDAEDVDWQLLDSPAFARDIDTPGDLLAFLHSDRAAVRRSRAYQYCIKNSIRPRLEMMVAVEGDDLTTGGAYLASRGSKHSIDTLLSREQSLALADCDDIPHLMHRASAVRDRAHGDLITYSRKVFIPLTRLCRDVCHYCTFATTPRQVDRPYLSVDEVLELVRSAEQAGCKEALFTLGEKPELRYRAAREALASMGFASTLEYVAAVAKRVAEETTLLPHINAGCMDSHEIAMLRPVSASMGIMLESSSERLCEKGMPHYGSPDKQPAARLETIRLAGEARVPFTSGILIGIGETRRERIESLLALRDLHEQYGHLQEVIVQNFRAKPDTKMAQSPDPSLDELLWTIAVARIVFGSDMHIQAPPNLSPGELEKLIAAGIDDWGGVSPLTPDHVNPEAPWPHLDALASQTRAAGKQLHERLTAYPSYIAAGEHWFDPAMMPRLLDKVDTQGWPREDNWVAGASTVAPDWYRPPRAASPVIPSVTASVAPGAGLERVLEQAANAERLSEADIVQLFSARGEAFDWVCSTANRLRQDRCGDSVRYVVNRNINYTNICYFKCQFCAFSKGKLSENLRGKPYDLSLDEVQRRTVEAWARGATEVCMQGGIHPGYTGQTYIDICKAIKQAVPQMHIHAFSPLEIWQGARSLGLDIKTFLEQLVESGLSTLPGTAAEILDDEVRAVLCPEKIRTQQWLHVMEAAHSLGIKTTATIMYGHIERTEHWARHLLRIRDLQERTGGFTEFVPLPFVPEEAPMYLKGGARKGPTFREAVLMHAVARLVLHGQIDNIQTSWVKMGERGVQACLNAGANDLGGTLMNESITRAAGAQHGQEMPPAQMDAMIERLGRQPSQRTTLYGIPLQSQTCASYKAKPLEDINNTPPAKIIATSVLHKPGYDDADILVPAPIDVGSRRS